MTKSSLLKPESFCPCCMHYTEIEIYETAKAILPGVHHGLGSCTMRMNSQRGQPVLTLVPQGQLGPEDDRTLWQVTCLLDQKTTKSLHIEL